MASRRVVAGVAARVVILVLVASALTWAIGTLIRQQADLAQADRDRQALAHQVRQLGGTPTPVPSASRGPVGLTGHPGPSGPRGPGPTQQQVRDAAAKYLALHPPARGRTGHSGMPGSPGPIGSPGVNGRPGESGKDGQNGTTGPQGPAGERGPKGEQGPAGDRGPAGPQGEQGPPGDTPSTVYCTPPDNPLGGDPWTCTTN